MKISKNLEFESMAYLVVQLFGLILIHIKIGTLAKPPDIRTIGYCAHLRLVQLCSGGHYKQTPCIGGEKFLKYRINVGECHFFSLTLYTYARLVDNGMINCNLKLVCIHACEAIKAQ